MARPFSAGCYKSDNFMKALIILRYMYMKESGDTKLYSADYLFLGRKLKQDYLTDACNKMESLRCEVQCLSTRTPYNINVHAVNINIKCWCTKPL